MVYLVEFYLKLFQRVKLTINHGTVKNSNGNGRHIYKKELNICTKVQVIARVGIYTDKNRLHYLVVIGCGM